MGDAPADYLAEQLRHIVGLEIRITRLEGKRKLNQLIPLFLLRLTAIHRTTSVFLTSKLVF
jgi:hypothetical protein